MKLRLEKDKVRLRLSSDELKILINEKFINEKIQLAKDNEFSYSVKIDDHSDRCMVNFKCHGMELSIPSASAEKWMNTNQVGIKETVVSKDGGKISVFVEEDLPRRSSTEKK